MASSSAQEQVDTSQAQMINLRILSPAFHISDAFNLGAISVDTTIGALKDKISQLVPEHPPTNHQRLIYCGHVLANDADTLSTVFGPALVQQQSDFTIHLVVRPQVHASPAGNTPTTQSRTHTPLPPSQHLGARPQGLDDNTATPPALPSNPSPTPTTNNAVPAAPRPIHRPVVPPGRLAAGMAAFMPPQFHPQTPPMNGQSPQVPPGVLPNTTTTRTVNTPDGSQYTVRVTNSTLAVRPQAAVPPPQPVRRPNQHITQHFGPHSQHNHQHFQAPPQMNPLLQQQMQQHMAQLQQMQMAHMPQMPMMHPQLAPHAAFPPPDATRPSNGHFNINDAFDDPVTANDVLELAELTTRFADVMQAEPQISPSARLAADTLRTSTSNIVNRIRESTSRPPSMHQAPVPQQSQHNMQPQTTTVQEFDATAATVYLLSSQAGPHALLFTPQGTYTGNSFHTLPYQFPSPQFMPGLLFPGNRGHLQPILANNTQPGTPAPGQPQAGLPDPPLQPGLANEPALQAAGQQAIQDLVQAQNQPVDLLQQMRPMLGQFWLLFRIIVFAYFFIPSDQSWYRPAVMAIITVAFYLLTGDRLGTGLRDAVRGWWQGVVGLPARRQDEGQEQRGPEVVAQPLQPRNDDAAATAAAPPIMPLQAEPPQQQRLSWLRQTLRPAERALALFVASLWPGVGERAGAARREEDDRQRREQQEVLARLERMRTEIIADAAQEGAATSADAVHVSGTTEGGDQVGTSISGNESASSAAVATGADVADGAEALRERKAGPRPATVEEEDGGEVVSAATREASTSGSAVEQ